PISAPLFQRRFVLPPFLPHHRICKHLDEHAADHTPSLKSPLLAIGSHVPIRERNPRGSFVHPLVCRPDECLKIGWVVGESRGPYQPIELCICRAIVQWQSVNILL